MREALIGQPFRSRLGLRARLYKQAQIRSKSASGAARLALSVDGTPRAYQHSPQPTPATLRAIEQVGATGNYATVLGRRQPSLIGTSASRRAALPAAVAPELLLAAQATGEVALEFPALPARILYEPGLIWEAQPDRCNPTRAVQQITDSAACYRYDRRHFERLFAAQPDPWRYTSAYEQTKYDPLLSLPRIEVSGFDDLSLFIKKLEA